MGTFVHRRTVRVEWGDCDPAQIVFYPRYFAMFDASTHELFRAASGLPKPELLRRYDIVGIPMVDTRARFLIPSAYGDNIVIESRISAWRTSSFDIEHRILKGDALAVEGFETRVWVGRDASRPGGIRAKPVPADVIAMFEKT
jgi:4-hydroxybenzoyl-CoA thioesterase